MSSIFFTLLLSTLPQALLSVVTLPPIHGQFDYQIGGAYTPSPTVAIVDRDNSDTPVSGIYSICYVNAFQSQADAKAFWKLPANKDLILRKNGKWW